MSISDAGAAQSIKSIINFFLWSLQTELKILDTSDFLRKLNVSLKRKYLFISLYFIITGQEPKDFTITVTVRKKTFQWFSYQFHGNSKNQFPFSICFLR